MRYLFALIPGVLCCIGNYFGDYFLFLNPIYLLVFVAGGEWFKIEDKINKDKLAHPVFSDFILILTVVLNTAAITLMLRAIYLNPEMSISWLLLYAFSTGFQASSIGITVAHELIHRKQFGFRMLGIWNMFLVNYGHFYIEHIKGHHRYVGTKIDPATSRKNESLYAFTLRTIPGQFMSALNIEAQRLKKLNSIVYGLKNFVVAITIAEVITVTLITVFLGWKAAIAFSTCSIIAICVLEYVNYIEHYGLERSLNEKFTAVHAWQSDNVLSRGTLVELSRHSDHHMKASKPFYTLETHHESPILPSGYFGVFYLAIIPPLWFKVVNPILEDFERKQALKISNES
jgi:alkane 1-monooxygenase